MYFGWIGRIFPLVSNCFVILAGFLRDNEPPIVETQRALAGLIEDSKAIELRLRNVFSWVDSNG